MGRKGADGQAVIPRLGNRVCYQVVLTSAPLVATPVPPLAEKVRPQVDPANVEARLRAAVIRKNVKLFGVAPAERVADLSRQLTKQVAQEGEYYVSTDKGRPKGSYIPDIQKVKLDVRQPSDYVPGARSVIVLGMPLFSKSVETAGQNAAEQVWPYHFIHKESIFLLGDVAIDLIRIIEDSGYQAVLADGDLHGLSSQVTGTFGTHHDLTCNRYAAVAAGLGELGRHGYVLTPQYGPHQRFVSIITDLPMTANPVYNGPTLCRQCNACVKACPTKALSAQKLNTLKLDGKTFECCACDRVRCDWSIRYGLVGEEGPKYCGSETDILPPEIVTPEVLEAALKKIDPLQKVYVGIVECCLRAFKSARLD